MNAKSDYSTILPYAALCLALSITLCCAGCSAIPASSGGAQADGSSNGAEEEMLSRGIHFPNEYLITYEIESNLGTLYQISSGKDTQGRIYFKRQLEEILFVPTDGGYIQYSMDTDGIFANPDNRVYTQAFVEEMAQEFLEYAQKYTLRQSNPANYLEKAQIAGRDCLVYEIGVETSNLTQKYTFAIDDETKICMEWRLTSEIMNHALPTDIGFICTEFVTADVKLPDTN